jgi:hypothetical protein
VVAKPNFGVEVVCENEHEHLIHAGLFLAARALPMRSATPLINVTQRNPKSQNTGKVEQNGKRKFGGGD